MQAPNEKIKCSHCQLEYDKKSLKKVILNDTDKSNKELYFCCNGCEGVYMLLAQSGLSGFYDRLGGHTLSPVDLAKSTSINSAPTKSTKSTTQSINQSQKSTKSAESKRVKSSLDSTPKAKNQRFSYLDEAHFLDKHTNKKSNHLLEVNLIIEGIHCAACVWLNEAMLSKQAGIEKISINYTNNKAKILFNPSVIKLSSIFAIIASMGYEAHIYDPSAQENLLLAQNKSYFTSFVVGVFCTMSIMMVAIAQYTGYFKGMSADMKSVLNVISCLLATPVLFYTGRVFFIGAYYGLKQGFMGMDFLVAFGASLTFIYSVYASFAKIGEPYFESVAMIVLFVFSGKFLEMRAKALAGDSLDKLQHILPNAVLVESKDSANLLDSAKTTLKDSKELAKGDIIHIREGEMLPCDGIMLSDGNIDTRSLSGESEPVAKNIGDEVLSGSIALDSFRYEVAKTYADSTMSNIIKLLEESLESKPQIQNLANALSKHFSRVVLFIALCGFLFWWRYAGAQEALIIAISVIVISCPCALALATPMASVVGISRGFRQGVLFKRAKFLETLAKCEVVLFDKTGTLTEGKLEVKKELVLDLGVDFGENLSDDFWVDFRKNRSSDFGGGFEKNLESDFGDDFSGLEKSDFAKILLADFLSHFTHPISIAIKDFAQKSLSKNAQNLAHKTLQNLTLKEAKQTKERGIYGIYESKNGKTLTLLGGSLEYLQAQGINTDEAQKIALDFPQMSVFACAIKSTATQHATNATQKTQQTPNAQKNATKTAIDSAKIDFLFFLQDSLKPSAKELISNLQKDGKKILLISGDRQCVVESIAQKLGITKWHAKLLPNDKLDIIRAQKNAVMIGDGLNDILALQSAEVGIAMGGGYSIAIAQSDVVVLDSSLDGVGRAFEIAKNTYARIKQNLIISLVYNALLIPLALCGFIIPLVAALSMSLSSLIVVANSMRK
ncbi:heavy metal translocating P-type ATPase [Helicobacter sp. T3_23-1056]